jgi:hypothetical protein
MNSIPPRSYNCKDEELPVVCGFAAISLTRDLNDFTTFSPMFDAAYVAGFKTKIEAVQDLVQPKSETLELKVITEHMYAELDSLISPINYLEGYLKLTGNALPISSTDFGLVQLRKSVRSRDVENVFKLLGIVEDNIGKYKTELTAKGLTEALITKLGEARTSLLNDKNKKYELVSNRMALVQNNLGQLNQLYDQLTEICNIGKILYKQTDKAKLKDYTFSQLMKQVRRTEKTAEEKPAPQPGPTE